MTLTFMSRPILVVRKVFLLLLAKGLLDPRASLKITCLIFGDGLQLLQSVCVSLVDWDLHLGTKFPRASRSNYIQSLWPQCFRLRRLVAYRRLILNKATLVGSFLLMDLEKKSRVYLQRLGPLRFLNALERNSNSLAHAQAKCLRSTVTLGFLDRITNNTGQIEAIGHALGWLQTLTHLDGHTLIASDSAYAIAACQALQRCSVNVTLIHTVRRIWRRASTIRSISAIHVRGHSGDAWNELADSLASAAHRFSAVPSSTYWIAPWYYGLNVPDEIPRLRPSLPFVVPTCTDRRPWYLEQRRKPNTCAIRRFVTFNALTLSPADLRKAGGGLGISARQAQLAKSFHEAHFDVIGMIDCRLPSCQASSAGFFSLPVFCKCYWL